MPDIRPIAQVATGARPATRGAAFGGMADGLPVTLSGAVAADGVTITLSAFTTPRPRTPTRFLLAARHDD